MNRDIGKKYKCVYNVKTDLKNNIRLGLWFVSLRWEWGYFFYFIRVVEVSNFLLTFTVIRVFIII